MASRGIDFLITYRVTKLLVTPFEKQEAYKFGIIDDKSEVLKKYKTLKTEKERNTIPSYIDLSLISKEYYKELVLVVNLVHLPLLVKLC